MGALGDRARRHDAGRAPGLAGRDVRRDRTQARRADASQRPRAGARGGRSAPGARRHEEHVPACGVARASHAARRDHGRGPHPGPGRSDAVRRGPAGPPSSDGLELAQAGPVARRPAGSEPPRPWDRRAGSAADRHRRAGQIRRSRIRGARRSEGRGRRGTGIDRRRPCAGRTDTSRTWWPTPFGTPHPARACGSRSRWSATVPSSPSRTPARACRASSVRRCSSRSPRARRRTATLRASASACPSSRGFAELHGGRAWVEERDGGGASFRVFIPGRVRVGPDTMGEQVATPPAGAGPVDRDALPSGFGRSSAGAARPALRAR